MSAKVKTAACGPSSRFTGVLHFVVLWFVACVAALGCGGGAGGAEPSAPSEVSTEVVVKEDQGDSTNQALETPENDEPRVVPSSEQVPISADDPSRGPDDAPVTIVAFLDLECPFCARVQPTLHKLESEYRGELRLVFKHNPLPFHKRAYPAAVAAVAVYEAGGDEAFFGFTDRVFRAKQERGELSDELFVELARLEGVRLGRDYQSQTREAKVELDMDLARQIGATGTPAFRINGATVSGAQPYEKFREVVDRELVAARELRTRGTVARDVYAERVAVNFERPAPPKERKSAPEDTTVWKVPIAGSPVLGPSTALVTIVEFAEFQCPFCKRVQPTLAQIRSQYGDDVRIVFKHNPLSFHTRAEPVAHFAIEVFKRQGNAGFWRGAELLFESQPDLSDTALEGVARKLGLSDKALMAAVNKQKHARQITADQEVAADFNARGTPHFFINGRRLSGAQPFHKFEALIDEQLEQAKALVAKGTPRAGVYAKIMATATPPPPPPQKAVPKVYADTPSYGSKWAPVTIHLFTDLQCPFCARLQKRLLPLVKKQGGKVRLVWYNLPLPFHKDARDAATVALEVRRQLGDTAFWKVTNLMFEGQKSQFSSRLVDWAVQVGAKRAEVEKALSERRFAKTIDRDLAIAGALGIHGTPATVIRGYYLSGAQADTAFEKLIRRAAKDARTGKKPDKLAQSDIDAELARMKPPPAPSSPVIKRPSSPGYIGASHILVQYAGARRAPKTITRSKADAKQLAATIAARAQKGEDFGKLAEKYSDGPSAKRQGDLGSFKRESMVQPFSDAAFALAVGQVSGVVETEFGFHVILRTR